LARSADVDVAGDVDVVIVTGGTPGITQRSVAAVMRELEDSTVAIHCVVVDNASEPRTSDDLSRWWPELTTIRTEEDRGYGRACNLGAREGQAEYVLMLNSDVFASRGAIPRLVSFLATNPECVATGARLVHAGIDQPQLGFAIRAYPTLHGQIALLLGLERLWPSNLISRQQLMADFDFERNQIVDAQPAGACLLVRREAYEAVGGFDESFYYWFEDVDLLRRLQARGRVAYCRDATFEHVGAASFSGWQRAQVIRARYAGLLRYFEKHHSRAEVLMLRAIVTALSTLRASLLCCVAPERARAYGAVAALAIGLRSFREVEYAR
jgi:N-acetylglucosaminyl-diphospho-decaprenol L-rhamnosyltransferase